MMLGDVNIIGPRCVQQPLLILYVKGMSRPIKMSIFLADGEQVIRKYRCVSVDYTSSDKSLDSMGIAKRKAGTDGQVLITNKRVIYYAESPGSSKGGMPAMHMQEAFVDKIASTEFVQADAKKSLAFPFALIIIGLLAVIAGLLADEMMYTVPGIIVLVFGIVLTVLSLRSNDQLVLMRINTLASEAGVRVSGMSAKDEQSLSFYMVPTDDFKAMAMELGAIVMDLQQKGDACIPMWAQ